MSRYFKIKKFSKWAKDVDCEDTLLINAVKEIEKGLVDANLGGNLFKKRIAPKGRGKSGGWRIILAMKNGETWFFLLGFSKNDMANISPEMLALLKTTAKIYLSLNDQQLSELISNEDIEEFWEKTQ